LSVAARQGLAIIGQGSVDHADTPDVAATSVDVSATPWPSPSACAAIREHARLDRREDGFEQNRTRVVTWGGGTMSLREAGLSR
jgi:hypothetical protein